MAAPLASDHTPAPSSPVRAAATGGLIGGVMGAVMSAVVNYLAIGLPGSASANAANHAISGLISGFLAGFIGIMVHSRKAAPTTADTAPVGASEPEK
ncbi:hypothetical protein FKN01_06225 [Streptomyces sp. 130]|uniref:hypothetical protein n=1 Tax=Streptomyces sp. 130 TaxID=2591006 RepID=UPI00117C3F9D|nr:hypothetical protein [Streptomyces sp. 130]TRV80361.1 hypothetical protein FKN01_06225 [Streptomyces sp. 130]